MRKIPLPDVDDEKVFDDITAAKHQPRRSHLKAARSTVLTAYHDYENAVPEVGNLPGVALTRAQSDSLINAFEIETAPMMKLRAELLKRVMAARCPFCGLSESSTLDHYLPKELNPQFAIFPKNLIPCCPTCNTQKRNKVLNKKNNIRLFLHPYFDVIPRTLFMTVNIALLQDAMALEYILVKPTGISLSTFRHLQSHFQGLGLADRYRRMALDDLRGQYHALARMYGAAKDADRVAAGLNEKAKDFEADYGKNHWLTVLYHKLAENEEFCDGGFEVLKKIQ